MNKDRIQKMLTLRSQQERLEGVQRKIQNLQKEEENLQLQIEKNQELFSTSPLTPDEEEFLKTLN